MSISAISRPSTRCSRSCALGPAVRGPPGDHLVPVGQEDLEQRLEPERPRLPVDQHQVVDAERALQRGQPVQVGEQRLRVDPDLALDDQAGAVLAVGEVLDVGDALQPGRLPLALARAGDDQLALHLVGDRLDDLLGADAVRQLDHGDRLPAPAALERAGLARARIRTTPRPVSYARRTSSRPSSCPPVGRSGPGTNRISVSEIGLRVGDQVPGRRHDLAEVVRDHVGRHPDRDPGRAVDQQVGEGRGQHLGLQLGAVVVGLEVDRALAELPDQQHRLARHPRLGVSRRGRSVVRAPKVSVPVDQRRVQREVLRQPHHGVVDRQVTVRMVLAHAVVDDAALGDERVLRRCRPGCRTWCRSPPCLRTDSDHRGTGAKAADRDGPDDDRERTPCIRIRPSHRRRGEKASKTRRAGSPSLPCLPPSA